MGATYRLSFNSVSKAVATHVNYVAYRTCLPRTIIHFYKKQLANHNLLLQCLRVNCIEAFISVNTKPNERK